MQLHYMRCKQGETDLPTLSTPTPLFLLPLPHHCVSVRVRVWAAPQCGESEVLEEEKKHTYTVEGVPGPKGEH